MTDTDLKILEVNKSPVNSDSCNGKSGYEGNTDGPHGGQMTQPLGLGTDPTLVQDLDQRQRAKDGTQQEIANGQVDDQNIVDLE